MGKQTTTTSTKSKKAAADNNNGGVFGKGNVTATQVAFIVDRYLSDNNFLVTRSAFRSEASSLLPLKSTANQSAKSLLKLGDMLDGYIHLKAQKILLDQEKTRLEHEKSRVQNLLRGMQHVMNAYNGAAPPLPSSSMLVNPTPACFPVPVHNTTPVIMSRGGPPSSSVSQHTSHSTPPTTTTTAQLSLKRRNTSKQATATQSSKRSRTNQLKSSSSSATTTTNQPVLHHPPTNHITPLPSTSPPLHGSSVVKCLFNSGPQTPSPSPTDKSLDNQTPPSSNKKLVSPPTQQYTTSTNRTVITSETIQLSPMKQVSYYSIESNHCISSPIKTTPKRFTTNRDHVKGRLDFDASSEILPSNSLPDDENSGGSPSQDDGFDFDLPNLDCLGGDFNFSDLLGDFDLDGFCPTDNVGSSPECLSGSPDKMVDGSTGDHELLSGLSSTFTEIQSEQDMNNISGPNSVTSVKSVTKCIKVFSPVKSRRSIGSSDREIVDAYEVV